MRTLRDLGVDLPTIKRVLDRKLSVAGVARAHAAAVDAQIRVLRLQRAVLAAAAARDTTTPQEMKLMHDLARLSAAERHNIVTDFVEDVFGGLDADPGIVERMRMAMPELPEEPTTEQVQAWIELAELVCDPDFRGRVRAMAQRSADDRAAGGSVAVRAATESPASGSERSVTAGRTRRSARKIADFGIGTYIRGLLGGLVARRGDQYIAFAPAARRFRTASSTSSSTRRTTRSASCSSSDAPPIAPASTSSTRRTTSSPSRAFRWWSRSTTSSTSITDAQPARAAVRPDDDPPRHQNAVACSR